MEIVMAIYYSGIMCCFAYVLYRIVRLEKKFDAHHLETLDSIKKHCHDDNFKE